VQFVFICDSIYEFMRIVYVWLVFVNIYIYINRELKNSCEHLCNSRISKFSAPYLCKALWALYFFCLAVKVQCPPTRNLIETPDNEFSKKKNKKQTNSKHFSKKSSALSCLCIKYNVLWFSVVSLPSSSHEAAYTSLIKLIRIPQSVKWSTEAF